jgi:nucleoside 2-deoxyribosyltransferase
MSERLKCTVLGSFKFKKDIDYVRQNFLDLGVLVLAPEPGSVYSPPSQRYVVIAPALTFRPLPSEVNQPIAKVEGDFLRAIDASDFTYLVNVNGYVGDTVSFEIGFVLARGIPLYAMCPIDTRPDPDLWWQNIVTRFPVLSPTEAVNDFKQKLKQSTVLL